MKRRRVEVEAVAAPATAAISPCVCYFPNGVPPQEPTATSSKRSHAEDIEFSMYAKPVGRSSAQNVLVGSRRGVDYVGLTASMEYTLQQPCSYAVGVYDKETGKLQLLPMHGRKVLRMEARLHGLDYGPSEYVASTEPTTREERLALNKKLVDSFGSTRRRRQLTAAEEGVVRAEKIGSAAALGQALEKGAQEAAKLGVTKEEVMARGARVRNLPPHHPEAKTASSAYRLAELIPQVASDSLKTGHLFRVATNEAEMERARERKFYPNYVLGRLHLLREADREKTMPRARALSFLATLLKLLTDRPMIRADPERGGLERACKQYCTELTMLQELLDLFYNHRKEGTVDLYERPQQKTELLLAYVLVLAQLVEGGGLAAAQFEALRAELKMNPADLVLRFREVGSVCTATTVKVAEGDQEGNQRSYNVTLLKNGDKTLAECFPKIKTGGKKK